VTENPVGRRTAGAVLDAGTLDYSWWASDGPTGGYLLRLALEFILDLKADVGEIRSITVQVLRRAAASSYTIEATALPGANGVRVLTVIFGQQGPFAIAHVVFARPRGEGFASDAMPPAVLPSAAYDVLKTSDGAGPPVLRQFDYRPTTGPDGSTARDGWDSTWVESRSRTRLAGPALLASVIDCWYPANHSRLIREHLQERSGALTNPASTHLTEARITFVTRPGKEDGALLLATQLCALSNGQHTERCEIWSERGALLAIGEIVRQNATPDAAAAT
jgi:hypothetical protein